jgi:hypothetical protein
VFSAYARIADGEIRLTRCEEWVAASPEASAELTGALG